MALPLPKVVADVEAGGPIVTAMRGQNALTQSELENKIKGVQAKYAPLTTQAEAASKLAYANLMGPQFLAKIMGNTDILANIPDDKKRDALNFLYQAAQGQGAGNSILNLPNQGQNANQPNLANFVNTIKNAFGLGQQQGQMPSMAAPQNAMNGAPQVNANPVANLPTAAPNQNVAAPALIPPTQNKWAENVGTYEGIKKEGAKLGELRAQAMDELGEQYQQAVQAEVPVQHLMEMTQNPVFINMRNKVPFFQDKQLQYLAKIGTPAEQRLVGDFITTATNAVANTVNGFRGRILDKEISMANQMKISPDDTWNVMVGKLGSIATFNEMTKQRAFKANQLMQKEHLNRAEAIAKADKMVDGPAIRKQMEGKLNPKPSDEDINYMAEKYKISPDEVRKRLKQRGIL